MRPFTFSIFIPGFTSFALTKVMAPGKTDKASNCMPMEGTATGPPSTSPRNTSAIQYRSYSRSDIPNMSFTGTPTAQERRPPEKIFRSSDKRDCTCAVVFAYHHGDILILRIILCEDRKSTRLNSSHANISYAVFCLKKKTHSS